MPDLRDHELNIHPKYLVVGPLFREFVILSDGNHKLDFASGPALFAASGLSIWDHPVGILSRIGEEFPLEWLREMEQCGFDTRGIRKIKETFDHRIFYGYTNPGNYVTNGPVGFFAKNNMPFEPGLLNYRPPERQLDPLNTLLFTSSRSNDIPAEYLDASAAHICPMDFKTHSLLQSVLRRGDIHNISIEANPAYLVPEYFNQLPNVVSGLTAFIVQEKDIRLSFRNRSTDLYEIAEALANYGCEMVVILGDDGSKYLFENTTRKKWLVPEYPSDKVNFHNSNHAFCGGLLAGYQISYQPVEAVLYGTISESIANQGLSPYYSLDAMSGFAQARLKRLREHVRTI